MPYRLTFLLTCSSDETCAELWRYDDGPHAGKYGASVCNADCMEVLGNIIAPTAPQALAWLTTAIAGDAPPLPLACRRLNPLQ